MKKAIQDKRIHTFDPESNEVSITRIYQSPYWGIEVKVEGMDNVSLGTEKEKMWYNRKAKNFENKNSNQKKFY